MIPDGFGVLGGEHFRHQRQPGELPRLVQQGSGVPAQALETVGVRAGLVDAGAERIDAGAGQLGGLGDVAGFDRTGPGDDDRAAAADGHLSYQYLAPDTGPGAV